VLVLASYRPGQAPSRALEALTDELIVHGEAHEMAIGPLDERAVGDYLGRRVPDAAGVDALARRSTGAPAAIRCFSPASSMTWSGRGSRSSPTSLPSTSPTICGG
jgi:hypothetical protein